MPKKNDVLRGDQRWALFRFSVIGRLLASPPARGQLKNELEELASKQWHHPITGEMFKLGASTIERWYYRSLNEVQDPVGVLGRKLREDSGSHPSLGMELRNALRDQYRDHPGWSYQLHSDNLVVLGQKNIGLDKVPSYSTVRRFMNEHAMFKRKRRGRGDTAGSQAAEKRFESHEIRSYESECPNLLWHLDFHTSSLRVALHNGQWVYPHIMGVLDDHTRLCIHAQWYLAETAENLIHALCQGFQKYGLPRAIMSDNGSAMVAGETVQGLERLGIIHERILPYSPYQNGKQEVYWSQIEGRLLAMLESCKDLTLPQLNEATQVWVESEYHRKVHSETGQTPAQRYINGKDMSRPAPSTAQLYEAFTVQINRRQRQSDGTLTVDGVRFEVPSRYRSLRQVCVRYASWNLSHVYLSDPRSGQVLCKLYPVDKHKNADGRRRHKTPLLNNTKSKESYEPSGQMAPLLSKLIAEYAATGLPPAYLPKDEEPKESPPSHE